MIGRILGSTATALIVVAVLGLACWFGYAAVTNATLITFRTGSMSPTMPQGALAVTLPASAESLNLGDVVTVQRAGEKLPVTHRIVQIGPAAPPQTNGPDLRAAAPGGSPPALGDPANRELQLRGDDNRRNDPLPYVVHDVRRVVFSVPGLGNALMMLQSPIGAGAMTLIVGALVVWAFWPKPASAAVASCTTETHAEEVPV
ncbi:MAG: S26 family signal peptidase [Actinobacteria bacterium]|nr:S26 family signal peptidase [Actinomycetota bacterium]